MNKNLFKTFAIAAMAVLAGACAKEQVGSGDGETVEMTFNVDVPETTITTKGLSDAAQVDELRFQLFIKEGTGYKMVQDQTVPVTNKKAAVKASLVKQQHYEAAFWAQASGTDFYETTDLRAVKMNIAKVKANEPKMDAFWMNDGFTATVARTKTIIMKRALAQVNFGTVVPTGADALSITKSQVVMKGVPTTLNVLLGNKDNSHSGSEDITFQDNAPISGEKLIIADGGTQYDYVATAYVFAPKSGDLLTDVSAKVTFNNGNYTTISAPNVPIHRNYRTNILGNLLSVDGEWNITITEGFDKNVTYDAVSANLTKGATVTLSEDYKVTIDNWTGINIPVGTESVLNLNGHRFANEDNGKTADAKSALVVKGKLTINGDGEVFCEGNTTRKSNVTTQPSNTCISVMEGGHLIIKGGNYSVGTDVDKKCNSTIYVENVGKAGKVEIFGGTFTNAQDPDGHHSFVLNQDDQLTEKCITVYGGTFIGFNPADNSSDGAHTNYVATGYKSIKISESPETWEVVDASVSVADQSELETTLNTVAKGESVYMKLADGEYALYGKTMAADKDLSIAFIGNGADNTSFKVGKETVNNDYGTDYSLKGASATFKKMKIVSTNGDYKGFAHAKELYFEDCTLVGQFAYMGLKASFKNCQFIQESANAYNLQTYTADEYVFDNCTFKASGKFLYTYREKTTSSYNVTFNNCHFIALAGETTKSAVSLKTDAHPSAGGAKYYVYFNKTDATDNVLVGELTGSRLYSSDLGYNFDAGKNTRETQAVVYVDNKKVWENGAKVE